tara:strand:- start:317 stop:643 length:327 start_codon:yes stop_codon:yes gene_type:complete
MVVLKHNLYRTRCPFSKKIVRRDETMCLFSQKQYNEFENEITNIFYNILPLDLIEKIIHETNYHKLIGRYGSLQVANWEKCSIKRKLRTLKLINYDDSSSDSEDEESF